MNFRNLFLIITLVFMIASCGMSTEEAKKLEEKARKIEIINEKGIPFTIICPNGLAFDGSSIWIAEYVSSIKPYKPSIIQISIPDFKIKKKIPGIAHMEGLATDGKYLWVGAPSKKISMIDIKSGRIIREYMSPTKDDADGLTWDGEKLWIATHYHGRRDVSIAAVEPQSFKVKKMFSIPTRDIGDIAWHQGYIWAVKYANPKRSDTEIALLLKINVEEEIIESVYKNDRIPKSIWGITANRNTIWIMNE